MAVLVDFLIGDPRIAFHPVRLMGALISFEEKLVRKICKKNTALFIGGALTAVFNAALGFLLPYFLLKYIGNAYVKTATAVYLCYSCIAARALYDEAVEVKKALMNSLESGRKRLAWIVGRDTDKLSSDGVIRACVETVAENTSDGVIAPLVFMIMFGAPGALCYKFINTMDSMIGYRNERYEYYGKFAAWLDDAANYIPARLTAMLMVGAAFGYGDQPRAIATIRRDHSKHPSPNSGFPEAAMAGLLGISLGGPNLYGGVLVRKPFIGERLRDVEVKDIDRACSVMFASEILLLLIYGLCLWSFKLF